MILQGIVTTLLNIVELLARNARFSYDYFLGYCCLNALYVSINLIF
jgi:hypothetical protein